MGEKKRQEAAHGLCDLQHWAAEDAPSWYQFLSLDCEKGEKKSLPGGESPEHQQPCSAPPGFGMGFVEG